MIGDWLEHRAPPAPDGLKDRIARELEAVSRAGGGPGGDSDPGSQEAEVRLGVAAVAALARAMSVGGTDREVAMDLLAADGLLTYACEAAVQAGDPQSGLDAVLSHFRDPVDS
jgi:hypothetical protein